MKLYTLVAVSILQGCTYSNYATRAEGDAVLHEVNAPYKTGSEWQFYTALVNTPLIYAEVKHMEFSHHAAPDAQFHHLNISFDIADVGRVNVLKDSVQVEVTNDRGDVIMPNQESWAIREEKYPEYPAYSVQYEKNLPNILIENISFKIEIDGVIQEFNYSFKVERKVEYTYWTYMMSV